MAAHRNARFPIHLAKLVTQRLVANGGTAPKDAILLQLLETLYFASLKTDEARPCRCTINYIDPSADNTNQSTRSHNNGWTVVPFRQPLPYGVRSLLKLADAADPKVSSLAVFSDDKGELFIWGLVDQELRYGDYVSFDGTEDPERPGLFQATITGVGAVSVYKNFALLGSLEQNVLVEEYHDVLWEGPIYRRLRDNLDATLLDKQASDNGVTALAHITQVKDELLVRWQNAICRMLFNIQKYGHGGGLLIVPSYPVGDVNVKYEQTYDRLPRALFRLAQHQILKRQTADAIAAHCNTDADTLPCEIHFDAVHSQNELDRLKNELLGCVHYIASLSRVDGFVLLDKSLVVHGFGVEARADAGLTDVYMAGDAKANTEFLRQAPLSQFGTRHRAMLRYCDEHEGALGFVISQDGDIRATMKYRGRLVLWENINVQLAYRVENRGRLITDFSPSTISGLFDYWTDSVTDAKSA
ncbi:MAG: hypothetical protein H6821_03675 [Planctomycetaceae bacterium]|nr:hypothetical protein [Planctomycetales bacterium]MCB9873256.1 hypothetical protein [Planctomycetaceae bacterium]MCB9939445.1 hypothetical protein [Planctomycetaceae bacterium]HRX77448.1 hypothetical protein [Pirellulaceae bacterium]